MQEGLFLSRMVLFVCKSDPGALRVAIDLVGLKRYDIIDALRRAGVFSSDVWVLFKDHCKKSLDEFIAFMESYIEGSISEEEIKDIIAFHS